MIKNKRVFLSGVAGVIGCEIVNKLIEQVAFEGLQFHKLCTYAFDFRPHLYEIIENAGFNKEGGLKEQCFFNGEYNDVLIHRKLIKN